jgi:hypothetical protein
MRHTDAAPHSAASSDDIEVPRVLIDRDGDY